MAQHIKDILEQFLNDSVSRRDHAAQISALINSALDPVLQKYVRLDSEKNGILYFSADAPAAKFQFNLMKQSILKAVREKFPDIKDIKVEN